MNYRCLGSTGMDVSVLAFGGSSIAGCFSETQDEESIKVVREAIVSGINLIDTAPWYGQGRGETILGEALQGVPRDAFYISTKVGRYELDVGGMFDFTASRVERSIRESLGRLGLEYVDIVQVHDIEFAPSVEVLLQETLPALQRVKDLGLARFIGVTGYPTRELSCLLLQSPVRIDTVLSYCHYNLLDTSIEDNLLPLAERLGVGVINASPLGMGLLTRGGAPHWHPASFQLKDLCKKAVHHCKISGVPGLGIERLAVSFAVGNPRIPTTLASCARLSELRENLSAATQHLGDAEHRVLEGVRQVLAETPPPSPGCDGGSGDGLGKEGPNPNPDPNPDTSPNMKGSRAPGGDLRSKTGIGVCSGRRAFLPKGRCTHHGKGELEGETCYRGSRTEMYGITKGQRTENVGSTIRVTEEPLPRHREGEGSLDTAMLQGMSTVSPCAGVDGGGQLGEGTEGVITITRSEGEGLNSCCDGGEGFEKTPGVWGEGYHNVGRTWEGKEVQGYWSALGRSMMLKGLYGQGLDPAGGGS
ncbi:unnamed protein product [Discosporangium mesarthrocarpum]